MGATSARAHRLESPVLIVAVSFQPRPNGRNSHSYRRRAYRGTHRQQVRDSSRSWSVCRVRVVGGSMRRYNAGMLNRLAPCFVVLIALLAAAPASAQSNL